MVGIFQYQQLCFLQFGGSDKARGEMEKRNSWMKQCGCKPRSVSMCHFCSLLISRKPHLPPELWHSNTLFLKSGFLSGRKIELNIGMIWGNSGTQATHGGQNWWPNDSLGLFLFVWVLLCSQQSWCLSICYVALLTRASPQLASYIVCLSLLS